jgi:hypothetical protein
MQSYSSHKLMKYIQGNQSEQGYALFVTIPRAWHIVNTVSICSIKKKYNIY